MHPIKVLFVVAAVVSLLYAFTKTGKDQAAFVIVGITDLIIAGMCA